MYLAFAFAIGSSCEIFDWKPFEIFPIDCIVKISVNSGSFVLILSTYSSLYFAVSTCRSTCNVEYDILRILQWLVFQPISKHWEVLKFWQLFKVQNDERGEILKKFVWDKMCMFRIRLSLNSTEEKWLSASVSKLMFRTFYF